MKKNILFLVVLMTLVFNSCTAPPNLEDAKKAYSNKDYSKKDYSRAIELFTSLAEDGNAEAQFRLGVMYYEGKGVKQDRKEALKWYRKATEEMEVDIKNAKNILNAGDYVIALGLFRLLAEEGNAEAQFNLAHMYDEGKGVAEDKEEALKWYRKATEEMEVDIKTATDMYNAEDYVRALGLFRLLAEEGNAEAQDYLGYMYYEGEGVGRDYKEAFRWFKKSAERGDIEAQYYLGYMYYEGEEVEKNYKEAFRWFKKSAERGYAKAQYHLGNMYYKGEGVEQSYKEAFRWYQESAYQGHAEAQYHFGLMYAKGEGVEQNDILAYMWLSISGQVGDKARSELNRLEKRMTSEEISEAKDLVNATIYSLFSH